MLKTRRTWDNAERNTTDLLHKLCSLIGEDQGLFLVRQLIRIGCPLMRVPEGREWAFVDGAMSYDLSMYWASNSVQFEAWNAPRVFYKLLTQVTDYAQSSPGPDGQSVWGKATAGYDLVRDVVYDVFPETIDLALDHSVIGDTAFQSMSYAMLVGDATDKGVAADWLRDRGADWAADHLQENTTGATPWWLRPEVCTFEISQT
jgi:hypothetical protein